MNTFLYIILFIIGTLFGSFYTLAVYRIPKRQDIVHKHSYCPNCNHRLSFLDLIPIFSYIFLKGKCRYCKQKIRPRYLILEILSGILFIAIAYLMKININYINSIKIIDYVFIVLYITFVVLISGIDKENRKMDKAVNIYGIAISVIYMVYLCIVEKTNIYRYGIYLMFYVIVLILDTITLRKYAKSTYINGILIALITMLVFTGEYITINTIIVTFLTITIYLLIYNIKQSLNKNINIDKKILGKINVGFCIGVSNITVLILVLIYCNYIL